MKRMLVVGIAALMLASCAANSGVIDIGNGTYFVSRQAATGFGGMGTLRADALQEAIQTCSAQNKTVEVTEETGAVPPFYPGDFPRVELTFRCE